MELWILQSLCTDECTYSVTETIAIFLTEDEAIEFLGKMEGKECYGEITVEKVKTGELL